MKKKEKSGSGKKYVYSTFFVLLILAEIFVAINYSEQISWIIGIGICILVDNYLLINTITKEIKEEKEKRTKQLQHIDNSKKALYILFKKNFKDFDKRMSDVEKLVVPISTDLETSHKKMENAIVQSMEDNRKVAKLIIGRNKENAEALMNYNGEFVEKFRLFEEKLEQIETKVSKMGEGTVVVKPEAVAQEVEAEPMVEEIATEEPVIEEAVEVPVEEPVIEEVAVEEAVAEEPAVAETPALDMSDPNKQMSPDDIAALLASLGGDSEETAVEEPVTEVEETVVEEPAVAETPALDMSDPNKPMSPDDIAALLESLGSGSEEPVAEVEEVVVEEPAVAETPALDMSDPNKPMSPDDIAALLESLGSGSDELAEEELGFEAMEETAVPDFSDPNKVMSPEDIAALIANM